MSASAIEQAFAARLLGALGPGSPGFPAVGSVQVPPLTVIVGPGAADQPSQPTCYVRCRTVREKYIGGIDGFGSTQIRHEVRVNLRYQITLTSIPPEEMGHVATVVTDAVKKAVRQFPRSVQLQDPDTGEWSQVGLLSNQITGSLTAAGASQRAQLRGVDITASVTEVLGSDA